MHTPTEQYSDENPQPFNLQFDPVTRQTEITGLPNSVGVAFRLPDGVDAQALYTSLNGNTVAQSLLASRIGTLMNEFLGIQAPTGEQKLEPEVNIEAPSTPNWAVIGVPSLQQDADRFYGFLQLDEPERGLMQLLGGAVSLQYWWSPNLFMKPEADIFKEYFTQNALPQIRGYIEYFEQVGKLDPKRAQRYLMQLEEVGRTMLAKNGKIINPIQYLVDGGSSQGEGLLSKIIEDVIFTANPERVVRLTKVFAGLKTEAFIRKGLGFSEKEVSDVLAEAQQSDSLYFIRENFQKSPGINLSKVLPAEDCRRFFLDSLYRVIRHRAVELQVNRNHVLPSSQRLLGR